MPLRARVEVLDFDGRSDARSRVNVISHIAPRHLILIHGSAQVGLLPCHCSLPCTLLPPPSWYPPELPMDASRVQMSFTTLSQAAARVHSTLAQR